MKARKKAFNNILPGLEKTRFEMTADAMYWLDDDGGKHKIVKAGVCANGLRDLCIYWKGPERHRITVGKIAETPKERILSIPKGDILWLEFEPPLEGGTCSMYLDIAEDESLRDMVKTLFRVFKWGPKGPDYEMFAGEEYWLS